jgi:hypothetical protein
VVLVVLDGLRPDAIDALPLVHMQRLRARAAHTLAARTVTPSVTAAAMGSLFTGVVPAVHGLESERFHVPRAKAPLVPLPRVLQASGVPARGYIRRLPWAFKPVGIRLARRLGFSHVSFRGECAHEILARAVPSLEARAPGLTVLHWPDADAAGHAHGWMSRPWRRAAMRLDAALGELCDAAGIPDDPDTLLIALADHGGGGARADHHDSAHPLDTTIPFLVAGAGVRPALLPPTVSLLDAPATVCDALGVAVPTAWGGRSWWRALSRTDAIAA